MQLFSSHDNFDRLLEQKLSSNSIVAGLQFPKEFKRGWLSRYEPRFVAILLGTFVLQVSLLWYLVARIERQPNESDFRTIQQRYAHLLMERQGEMDFISKISKKQETFFYTISETNEFLSNSKAISASETRSASELSGRPDGSDRAVSSEAGRWVSGASQGSGKGSSGRSEVNAVSPGGSAIGILAYVSDAPHSPSAELRDVLGFHGAGNGGDVGSLGSANYSRFVSAAGQGTGSGNGSGTISGLRGPKTVIIDQDGVALAPLDRAGIKTIAKNTELETSQELLLKQKAHKAIARKPEQITQVVMQHNRSIQDCYKQALRHQPGLKGKVVVRFFVAPDGTVENVELISSTIDYEPMIQCILYRIRRWNDFGECDISLGTVGYRQTYVFGY